MHSYDTGHKQKCSINNRWYAAKAYQERRCRIFIFFSSCVYWVGWEVMSVFRMLCFLFRVNHCCHGNFARVFVLKLANMSRWTRWSGASKDQVASCPDSHWMNAAEYCQFCSLVCVGVVCICFFYHIIAFYWLLWFVNLDMCNFNWCLNIECAFQ